MMNNIFYMSSGIRKKDRIKIVDHIIKINNKNNLNNNDEKLQSLFACLNSGSRGWS